MHSFLSRWVIVCVKWLPKEQTFRVELLHLPSCQVSVTCLIEACLALKGVNTGSKKSLWNFFQSLTLPSTPHSPQVLSASWELAHCLILSPQHSFSCMPFGLRRGSNWPSEACRAAKWGVLCLVAGNSTGQWGSECWEQKAGLPWALAGPCIMQVRNFSLLTDVNTDPLALVLFQGTFIW